MEEKDPHGAGVGPVSTFHSKVAGTTYRKDVPVERWDKIKAGDRLIYKMDPCGLYTGQPHTDRNAIALYHQVDDESPVWIGYIPKDTAQDLAEKIRNKEIYVDIHVEEVTGLDKPNRGINLKIYTRYRSLEYLNRYNPFPVE